MKKKTVRPEYWWSEKRQMYRKRFLGADGAQHDAWGRTKAECRARKEEMEAEIARGVKPGAGVYVYEYAKLWYELKAADVKESTRERYATNINGHICPVIGGMLMGEVTRDDVLRVRKECAALSRGTQAKVLSVMRMMFRAAVQSGIIEKNPCDDVKPSGKKAEKRKALTKPQQAALLEAVKGTKAEGFVKLCLYAGLRREEALGLCWDCVHLSGPAPYLEVRRAVNWNRKGRPELTEELKSPAAFRKIPLPRPLQEYLEGARKPSGFVISNAKGQMMSKQSFRRLWEAVKVRTVHGSYQLGDKIRNHDITVTLDFAFTPHELRHTYITELLLSGANLKLVQYLAGHATAAITLEIYAHLMENQPQDTQGAVLKAFG